MPLIILDRDGVINEDSDDFIKSPDEWLPIPGSLEAIAQLTHNDYMVAVATNQSGIARGLFDSITLNEIHQKMHLAVQEQGGAIDAIFYCPHGPDGKCKCRKPKPGLLEDAAQRFHLPLSGVPVIGDSLRDIQAAQAAGASPYLVLTGKGKMTQERHHEALKAVPQFENLQEVVKHLLNR